MFKSLTLAAALYTAAFIGGPASAWEDVKGMNRQIDQTNFIVGNGCSGTLISVEYRLLVTAYHCVRRNIKTVTREEVGKDGKIEEVQYEERKKMTIEQRDYDRFDRVGALSYQVNIVGYYKEHDLALLQLVGKNLRSTMAAPILPEGEEVQRGEIVVAVGNPRGLDASVTAGVISSTSRSIRVSGSRDEMAMLQFDANVQPGSSGGALYNDRGQYIGTVVAAMPGSDLSLAIPVYDLHTMLEANCFASIFDTDADDEACRNPDEEEDDDKHAGHNHDDDRPGDG